MENLGGMLDSRVSQIKEIRPTNTAITKYGELLQLVEPHLLWTEGARKIDKTAYFIWANKLNDYKFAQEWTNKIISGYKKEDGSKLHILEFVKGFITQWKKRLS